MKLSGLSSRAVPLLICFDGWVYSKPEFIPTPKILDNLIAAGRIPPILALFIDQAPQPQRNIELSNNQPCLDFVADEWLPGVRQRWHATSDPSRTIVCGSSAGGVTSVFFAFRRPEVFVRVLSQSGAFWVGQNRDEPGKEWLTSQIESSPKRAIRFVLQVGVLEIVNTPKNRASILDTNPHLREVLTAKRYPLHYRNRGRANSWRGGIAEGLIDLMK